MKIKDSALKALIAEVEAEIGDLLKSEKQKLSKAAEDLDEEKEGEKPEMSAAPEADPSAEASSEASAPMEDEQHEESQDSEDHAAPEASAPMEDEQKDAMKPEDDMAEAAPMDPEALKAEYMKLPQDELEMHLMAAKAAMMEMSGGQADAKAPAAPAAAEQSAPAMKAEEKPHHKAHKAEYKAEEKPHHKAHKAEDEAHKEEHKDAEMHKSEKNISNERLKELEAQVEGLVKALDLALGQPMRKAVTSVTFVPRTEETKPPLTKGVVMEQLKEVTKQNLKKSDRELINRYCLGEVEVDKIQHLLQVK